jgi:imidazolonepropionase-like amidohydrolase
MMRGSLDVVNARIWTGDGRLIESGTLQIRDGRIRSVTDMPQQSSSDAPALDAAGATVIPGLMDAHVHLTTASSHTKPVDNATYRALATNPAKLLNGVRNSMRALASGFTTLRVMGHRDVGEPELRDFIDSGELTGPRLRVAPWVVSMTGGRGDLFWPSTIERSELDTADGVDGVRKMVRLQRKRGADFIKVTASGGTLSAGDRPHWPNYTEVELRALSEEAHDYDLTVAAHAHSIEGVMRAVRAGVDTIEHGSYIDERCIELMLEHRVHLVPTLAISDWVIARGQSGSVTAEGLDKMKASRDKHMETFIAAVDAGVSIAAGTDSTGTICPFGHHARELELYVEAGLSPEFALTAATRTASEAIGVDDVAGTLAPGKSADFLIVEGDPLQDITLLRGGGLRQVFKDGIDVTDPWPTVMEAMAAEPSLFR